MSLTKLQNVEARVRNADLRVPTNFHLPGIVTSKGPAGPQQATGMRLLGRHTQVEELAAPAGGAWQSEDGDLPSKAQSILGATRRPGTTESKGRVREQREAVAQGRLGGKNIGLPVPHHAYSDTAVPKLKDDMRQWQDPSLPNPLRGNPPTPKVAFFPQAGESNAVQPHQFYPSHQRSIESIPDEHYEASKQPLYVSQQTSASAVRDMGLHKTSPRSQTDTQARTSKPLKSAMKPPKGETTAKHGENAKKPKKLDLTSLFPQPKASSTRLLHVPPAKFVSSPSAATDNSDYFPQETLRAQLVRNGSKGRFQTQKSNAEGMSSESVGNHAPRVKVFEPDVFDNTQTKRRRPPKGIQNWFDGFDISSDEEEEEPVELPADPPRPSVETIPSTFSPYGGPPTPDATPTNNKSMAAHLQETPRTTEPPRVASRQRGESQVSQSTIGESVTSSAMPDGRERSGESRLAHSQLDQQSILSLSDESEDDADRGLEVPAYSNIGSLSGNPSQASLQRPEIPPRRMPSTQTFDPESKHRHSYIAQQPIRSTPLRPADSAQELRQPNREPQSRQSEQAGAASRTMNSQRQPAARASRNRLNDRNAVEKYENRSVAAESMLSEAAHVMAVTEEEMMLLELMRQKRNAMQKHSFSEGYRLALKQEQEALARRRESAHTSAIRLLKKKEEMAAEKNSRRQSKTETLFSEELDQLKRYSAMRKADVDKSFKMGRFLAMEELPEIGRLAQMERFLMMKPSLAEEMYNRMSGTEIETGSMYTTEQEQQYDTQDCDGEEEETGEEYEETENSERVPSPVSPISPPTKMFSPMQRLTEQVKGSPATAIRAEQESPEAQHDKLRAFLASRSSAATGGMGFPTPPSNTKSERQARRRSRLAPGADEIESSAPKLPTRSPNRLPVDQGRQDSKQSSQLSTPKQPHTRHVEIASPAPEAVVSAMSMKPPRREHIDYLTPSLDFAPLELPTFRTGSPSLSTGRPSPLTPTFPPANNSAEKVRVHIADGDNVSFQGYQSSPNQDHHTNVVSPQPISHSKVDVRRLSRKVPPKIDTAGGKGTERITSMSSITSAGEDVLAAWAELGGSDALAARRRGR